MKISSYRASRVDAVVRIRAKDGNLCHLGVEYERTLKSKKRCREKVKNYYLKPQVEVILFIYESHRIYRNFVDIEKEFSQDNCLPKLFFLSGKEITSSGSLKLFSLTYEKTG